MTETSTVLRTGRKFDQVLKGAREVFMADGFEGASVDDIAKAANVSKATLYSYFPDKRLLFREVVQTECGRMSEQILSMVDETQPAREVLTVAAQQLAAFLISRFAQQIFRICVAERDRFPELGRAFYEAGPRNGCKQLMDYLEKAIAKGELQIDDVELAAEQFSELCKAKLWMEVAFGVRTSVEQAEIDVVAHSAVDMFMARYGV
ncbi:TetR/AcrR family transcriptional regulator [Ruegeria sp. 2012CJ41-6]|uniref:TetR/AcrR family transcriptional regulator n=1 Tax=Ruegeria spongiae TaxID=2942209 RepID=A0ABT0PYQ3_9RHOB|nr:TetR/AcrR family transcriptional regulator [Ruegeria spongiae]MCL6282760.1 TetR/AcrR family transcriptional regulator [Ruegeria spongiae]